MYRSIFAAIALCLASAAASATNPQVVSMAVNAQASCDPALAVYDAGIRQRPLAIQNEGNTPGFVSCGFAVDENADNVRDFGVQVRNRSLVTQTVTCTAVVGDDRNGASYYVKSVTLPAGSAGVLSWIAAQNGENDGWDGPVGGSCLLPAGTSLTKTAVSWVR